MNIGLKSSIAAHLTSAEEFIKTTDVVIIANSTDRKEEELAQYLEMIDKAEIETDLKDKEIVKDQEFQEIIPVVAASLVLHANHLLKLSQKLFKKKVVLLRSWDFIQILLTKIFTNCFLLKELYKNVSLNKTILVDH